MRVPKKGIVTGVAGTAIALTVGAGPAFAAGTITTPSTNPYTVPVDGSYNPVPFDIAGTGFQASSVEYTEICDGLPSTTPGWSPGDDCDNVTSPEGVPSTTAGGVTWTASNSQQQIGVFRGESPQDFFNCLAPADVPGGTTQNANGSWNIPASDTQTSSGSDAIDPNVPSWTNCQLRVSSNNAAVTSDQAFDTLSLQSGPTGSVPETPYAVLLPIGAVAVLGGGVVIMRRRRKSHAAA